MVEVSTLTGATHKVEVKDETPSLSQLRTAICTRLGVGEKDVDLLARGRMLDEDGLKAALKGSQVQVVPRVRSGFDLTAARSRCVDSVQGFQKLMQELSTLEPNSDVSVTVQIQDSYGKTVEKKLCLSELSSMLSQLKQMEAAAAALGEGVGVGVVESESSRAVIGGASRDVITDDVNYNCDDERARRRLDEDAETRRKLQEVFEKGREIYAQREQKKAESSRISEKLDVLRAKRETVRRQRESRLQSKKQSKQQQRTGREQPPQLVVGFAGLRKGFLC